MKCPKCSQELSTGAAMCPRCGTFVPETEQSTPVPKPQTKKTAIIAVAATLFVVIVGALLAMTMFAGRNVTQGDEARPANGPSVTNAPPATVATGPSVTNAPPPGAPPAAPPLAAPTKQEVPKEVLDYLEFVKQIEAKRQAMLKDTTRAVALSAGQAQAESMLDMINMAMDDTSTEQRPKKVTSVEKELTAQVQNWYGLVREFDSKSPPQTCQQFGGQYRAAITTEAMRIAAIMSIIGNVNWSDMESVKNTLSQLQAMKADPNLQGGIDKAVETADGSLSDLCTNYGISKPFDVKKESDAGGSIIGGGL